jgi:hypothetical protein
MQLEFTTIVVNQKTTLWVSTPSDFVNHLCCTIRAFIENFFNNRWPFTINGNGFLISGLKVIGHSCAKLPKLNCLKYVMKQNNRIFSL